MKKKIAAAVLTGTMLLSSFAGTAFAEEAAAPAAEASDEIAFQKFPEVVEVHIGQGISPTDSLPEGLSVENNQYTDYLLENYNIKVVVD